MPTVTRVLPWRRHQLPAAVEVEPLLEYFRAAHPKASADTIIDAYEVAAEAHEGQFRKSGEPYVTHPLAVATIAARYGMDETTVVAALLHDAVEDTGITLADVELRFGADAAAIVDGVTKLDRIHFESKEAQQAATLRKMLVAMAKDLRVLVIKLSDRLHNMRTIAALPAWKQERTAHETLDIYAPLAHRLGMGEVKQQLEDLCFASLYPKRYAEIDHMVASRAPEREIYLTQVVEEVRHRLVDVKIEADVTGRPKHLWSIYEKMMVRGKQFDEIYDLVGLRVIVDSVKDCYAALGSIHSLWTPVQGRFKDYIAMPKFNLYQSLHTTVIGPQGKPVEVQIRTREMHSRAEWGVAAHFSYKEGGGEDVTWLSRMIDWQQELSDPRRVHGQPEDRPRTGRGVRLHAEGRRGHDAGGFDADRLRVQHPHRGRSPVCGGPRRWAPGTPRHQAQLGRHRRDLHVQGRGLGPVARLVAVRGDAVGGHEDQAVVQP